MNVSHQTDAMYTIFYYIPNFVSVYCKNRLCVFCILSLLHEGQQTFQSYSSILIHYCFI